MSAQHTPGPWNISGIRDGGGAHLHIGAPGSPMVLASMNEVHVDTDANARLIAAAPELLSHLEFAVKILRSFAGGAAQVQAMETAIAKATGAA